MSNNGSGAGWENWIFVIIGAGVRAVIAWLMSSLELGMRLLGTVTSCIRSQCWERAARLVTWLSTWPKRSGRRTGSRRWGCHVGGLHLTGGLEVGVCVLYHRRVSGGENESLPTDISQVRRWNVGRLHVWVIRIRSPISRKLRRLEVRIKLGDY